MSLAFGHLGFRFVAYASITCSLRPLGMFHSLPDSIWEIVATTMSNLYRSAIHARLSKLPPMPPLEDFEDGDEEEEEVDTLGALPSMPPPPTSLPRSGSGSASAKPSHLDGYKPVSASGYFDQALEVNVLSAQLNFRVYYTPPKGKGGTVLVCHHGAGYSALSFACFAKEVTRLSNGECGIFAFDVRRHGM